MVGWTRSTPSVQLRDTGRDDLSTQVHSTVVHQESHSESPPGTGLDIGKLTVDKFVTCKYSSKDPEGVGVDRHRQGGYGLPPSLLLRPLMSTPRNDGVTVPEVVPVEGSD